MVDVNQKDIFILMLNTKWRLHIAAVNKHKRLFGVNEKAARLRVKQVGASKNICLKIKLVGKDVFVTAATDFCLTKKKKKFPAGPTFHRVVCVSKYKSKPLLED